MASWLSRRRPIRTHRQFARRWTFYIGPDGIIQEIDKSPGTQNAGQNVIAKLQALGVKEKK